MDETKRIYGPSILTNVLRTLKQMQLLEKAFVDNFVLGAIPTWDGNSMTYEELWKQIHTKITEDNFHKTPNEELYDWTQRLLSFFYGAGISWEACRTGTVEILKLNDEFLKYLISLPNGSYQDQDRDQFAWMCGQNPGNDEDCVYPDEASMYLASLAIKRERELYKYN